MQNRGVPVDGSAFVVELCPRRLAADSPARTSRDALRNINGWVEGDTVRAGHLPTNRVDNLRNPFPHVQPGFVAVFRVADDIGNFVPRQQPNLYPPVHRGCEQGYENV